MSNTFEVIPYFLEFVCTKELSDRKIPDLIESVREHFCHKINTRDLLDFFVSDFTSTEDRHHMDTKLPCIRIGVGFIPKIPINVNKNTYVFFETREDKDRFGNE